MDQPIIETEALGFIRSGVSILEGISLRVNPGEYVSIIGPNGAGKTTLIKCIAGLLDGWTGSIRLEGKPFDAYGSKALARLQSYVPQAEGHAHPLTVEEFVSMGRYPHLTLFSALSTADYEAIDRALELAQMEALRARRMDTLSGGERQMAFIAAALAQEAKILLLDEPTTFLDYRHESDVHALLNSACREQGMSMVAVHHDVNSAARCSDRIYALKKGRVFFEGEPQALLETPRLEELYETDFSRIPAGESPLPIIVAGGDR